MAGENPRRQSSEPVLELRPEPRENASKARRCIRRYREPVWVVPEKRSGENSLNLGGTADKADVRPKLDCQLRAFFLSGRRKNRTAESR